MLELDLPAATLSEVREPELMRGARPAGRRRSWLADGCNDAAIIELADEAAVRAVAPDFAALDEHPPHGGRHRAAATSRTSSSRVFVPYSGSTRTR